MENTIHSIKRGAWVAEIRDRNLPPANHNVPRWLRYQVMLSMVNGFRSSWPIQYDDGTIGYEFDPPRDAVRAVKAAYKYIKTLP